MKLNLWRKVEFHLAVLDESLVIVIDCARARSGKLARGLGDYRRILRRIEKTLEGYKHLVHVQFENMIVSEHQYLVDAVKFRSLTFVNCTFDSLDQVKQEVDKISCIPDKSVNFINCSFSTTQYFEPLLLLLGQSKLKTFIFEEQGFKIDMKNPKIRVLDGYQLGFKLDFTRITHVECFKVCLKHIKSESFGPYCRWIRIVTQGIASRFWLDFIHRWDTQFNITEVSHSQPTIRLVEEKDSSSNPIKWKENEITIYQGDVETNDFRRDPTWNTLVMKAQGDPKLAKFILGTSLSNIGVIQLILGRSSIELNVRVIEYIRHQVGSISLEALELVVASMDVDLPQTAQILSVLKGTRNISSINIYPAGKLPGRFSSTFLYRSILRVRHRVVASHGVLV